MLEDSTVPQPAGQPSNLSENIELALREEIRTTQGAQSNLIKWKLIAVAVVGATGLGLPEAVGRATGNQELRYLLLCLIPLICLYADLICLHYMLRIITIGTFIKASYEQMNYPLLDYEGFVGRSCSETSRVPFNLEEWAILRSSYLIDGIVIILAATLWILDQPRNWSLAIPASWSVLMNLWPILFVAMIGAIGIRGTWWLRHQYRERVCRLEEVTIYRLRGNPAELAPPGD